MTKPYNTRITCRLCGHAIHSILNLGNIYLNDFVTDDKQPVAAPLDLAVCENCQLVQLKDTSDLDLLYRQYWYKSALNKSMIAALQDIVDNVESLIDLKQGDVVVDIGCNDGTMLSQFKTPNLYKIGFDPALNLAELAYEHCDELHSTYFGDASIELPQARVITSIAMFYDLEDPHTFVELIRKHLAPDGIWVVQFTDLLSMLVANAFDAICHEHLEYYSFSVLQKLFSEHHLEVFDVSHNDVNGGSIRMYIGHRGARPITQAVREQEEEEDAYMRSFTAQGTTAFEEFTKRVLDIRKKVRTFLLRARDDGLSVFAMGASTKGNTLLQYFDIDTSLVQFAAEVNKDKFGKKTVGTNIPIISEEAALAMEPDYFIVLPWHFIDMLLKVHKPYLEAGGKIMVPMPEPAIYYMADGEIVKEFL